MSDKKVPNTVRGRREGTGAAMVDPAIVRWRKENRKLGRCVGKHMEHDKKRAKAARDERAQPDPTKRKFF